MLLKEGSKGPEVKALQEKLGVEAIGTFGPKTKAAVMAWQKENGLEDDGIVGPDTLKKMGITLSSQDAQEATPVVKAEEAPAAVAAPVANTTGVNITKLKGMIPDQIYNELPLVMEKFGCSNSLRLAHLVAQCSHESGGFKSFSENLNYGAKGLRGIFPKYFPTDAVAAAYERKPEKIANKVYSSRMGNGDEASGDGFKYRGRGAVQLTGRSNYAEFDKTVSDDILANPDLVATKYALASAAFFFQKNKLWSICDQGSSDAVVTSVTKRVNGGTIGLPHRLEEFHKFWKALS